MISRVAIKNFRSLRDVELSPGPLTVLIGPNGSGKSNLLDALKFLKAIYSDPAHSCALMKSQLEDRGGYAQVIWGGYTDSHLRFEVEFSSDDTNSEHVGFTTEIAEDPRGMPQLEEERHLVDSVPAGNLGDRSPTTFNISLKARRTLDKLRSWQFYNFSPDLMRKPTKVKQEKVLNELGSNLSSVIHSLFSEGHPDLEEAVGMLQVMVPTVERLVSPIFGDGQTYVALKEKGIEKPIGAWGLSDGTLLALALSVALVVRPEPELICVETPEIGIHPQMMEAVADMLEVASRDTQVIVTTQSPYLLDWLPYDSFVVVEKKNGETKLKPLKNDDVLRETVAVLGTGPAWYSGYLGGEP